MVNALSYTVEDDLDAVIQAARAHGGTVFIGISMTRDQVRQALVQLDDACAEIAGRVGARGRR